MPMESQLVNDIVYRKFIDLYPDVVLYTIFDSFIVETRYASQLHMMMIEEGSLYFKNNCAVNANNLGKK